MKNRTNSRLSIEALPRFLVIVSCLVQASCSGDRPQGQLAGPPGSPGEWSLSDDDIVRTVGEADGLIIDGYGGALLVLEDGTIVLANGRELHALDATGQPSWKVGRQGAGPGEFTGTIQLFHFGGGVGAFDTSLRRMSLFDGAGDYLRTIQPTTPLLSVAGVAENSNLVGVPPGQSAAQAYVRYAEDGAVIDTIATMDAPEPIRLQWTASNGVTQSLTFLCSPRLLAATVGSTLYVADAGSGQVTALTADGTRRQVHEVRNRRLVTEEALQAPRSAITGRDIPQDVASEALARFGAVGDPQPAAWDVILPDQNGRIWLQISECGRAETRTWEVVDTSGVYLGSVTVPRGLGLRAVRGSTGVAYTWDELDVASVNILRLPIPD